MAHGFSSPIAALDAIVLCLGEWPIANTVIHTGSAGSGLGIDCCPALVRVETASFSLDAQSTTATQSMATMGRGCKAQDLSVTVSYRECWIAQDNTPGGRPAADYQVMGTNVVLGWWTALERLSCCSPTNQLLSLEDVVDYSPDGCVGWDMTLVAKVSFCGCP